MKWRAQQPIHILELRCRRLRQPLLLPQSDAYYGCFSWLDVPAQMASLTDADPVLPDDMFATKQAALQHALSALKAEPVLKRTLL